MQKYKVKKHCILDKRNLICAFLSDDGAKPWDYRYLKVMDTFQECVNIGITKFYFTYYTEYETFCAKVFLDMYPLLESNENIQIQILSPTELNEADLSLAQKIVHRYATMSLDLSYTLDPDYNFGKETGTYEQIREHFIAFGKKLNESPTYIINGAARYEQIHTSFREKCGYIIGESNLSKRLA